MQDIVNMELSKELVWALLNGAVSSDFEWPQLPQTTPFSIFCVAFHIFIVGAVRYFKFGG